MNRPVINPGTLIWSGEHWINYIRQPGAESDAGMVSLYHTRYSAAGEGTVAFVRAPAFDFEAVCTDNREVAQFITGLMIREGNPFHGRDMPVLDAVLKRAGDIRTEPAWIIQTDRRRIVSTWTELAPPVIAEGPAPTFSPVRDFFTLLFFAAGAHITVDGQTIEGAPYLRDIWQKSIGGLRSSCVFALAETMTAVPE
jgi:hypothetical protein